MEEIECIEFAIGNCTSLSLFSFVGKSSPTNTSTYRWGEPFAKVYIGSNTIFTEITIVVNGVYTSADTDKPIVPKAVCLVSATDDLAIGVTIVVLLCIGIEGDGKEGCACKDSKNTLNSFHNV